MYKYILFDLDGTLVDTSEGILYAAKQALLECGIQEDNIEKLKCFIGPPLKDAFVSLYEMSEEEALKASDIFRRHYSSTGKLMCALYQGIEEMLKQLTIQQYKVFVATSKPTVFSIDILKHLGIEHYFIDIVGSNLDHTRSKKVEIIEYILEQHNISDRDAVIMVGDKSHDLIGAEQSCVHGIGVTYGFGSFEELSAVQHDVIVDTPQAIMLYLEGCAE